MKKNELFKLIISIMVLGSILFFSYKKNEENLLINPSTVEFQIPTGFGKISDYKNHIVLLYFGFLTCPEACPTTLASVASAFKKLDSNSLQKIKLLFIDLDPERDTIEKLNNYTHFFHPNIIPMRLDLITLKRIARYYGVTFVKVPLKNSAMVYTIDHSTDIIVLNSKGEIIDNIHHDTSSEMLTGLIKKYIEKDF